MENYSHSIITSQPNGWVLTATLPSGNIVEVRCRTFKQVAQFIEEHDIILTIGDIIKASGEPCKESKRCE